MAVFEYTRPLANPYGTTSKVSGFVSRILVAVIAWNDARVTRKSLAALSDRELDDLGLVRGDLDDIARGTYRR